MASAAAPRHGRTRVSPLIAPTDAPPDGPVSVGSLLRREGRRAAHALDRPLVPRARDLAEAGARSSHGVAVAAGALIAVTAVLGSNAVGDPTILAGLGVDDAADTGPAGAPAPGTPLSPPAGVPAPGQAAAPQAELGDAMQGVLADSIAAAPVATVSGAGIVAAALQQPADGGGQPSVTPVADDSSGESTGGRHRADDTDSDGSGSRSGDSGADDRASENRSTGSSERVRERSSDRDRGSESADDSDDSRGPDSAPARPTVPAVDPVDEPAEPASPSGGEKPDSSVSPDDSDNGSGDPSTDGSGDSGSDDSGADSGADSGSDDSKSGDSGSDGTDGAAGAQDGDSGGSTAGDSSGSDSSDGNDGQDGSGSTKNA
ncbi:hypothetical protein [Pseudonocardia charpentierae]|uniref:Uncharacterized protein n=1 Tax=Pseudonocardia charpentierae TaxID=3075545 RepID=A0ABU2N5W0_9PSEU|nr:hypothetical protein [Pseudonocardia sp. DSM 45834]MDT0349323.1 hypothetical protein [Pseudonocardia sp. DSM 45834]